MSGPRPKDHVFERYARVIEADGAHLVAALGDPAFRFSDATCLLLSLEADGHHAWTWHGDGVLRRWSLADGAQTSRARIASVSSPASACFSRDHGRLAVAERDGRVAIHEPYAGRERTVLRASSTSGSIAEAPLSMLCYAPDRRFLIGEFSSGVGTTELRVWDVRSEEKLALALPYRGCALYLPDATGLVVGTLESPMRLARVDATGTAQWQSEPRFLAVKCACSRDGSVLFAAGPMLRGVGDDVPLAASRVRMSCVAIDARTGATRFVADAPTAVDSIEVSPDGARVWLVGAEVWCLDARDGALLASAKVNLAELPPGVRALGPRVQLAPDESRVWFAARRGLCSHRVECTPATGGGRARVEIDATEEPTSAHASPVFSTWVDPPGRRALAGCEDGSVRVWNLRSGECDWVLEGLGAPVRAVLASPDGRLAFAASHRETVAWALDAGLEVFRVANETASQTQPLPCALAIDPGGALLAAAHLVRADAEASVEARGARERYATRVRTYDPSTQQQLGDVTLDGLVLEAFGFDPSGTRLLVASRAGARASIDPRSVSGPLRQMDPPDDVSPSRVGGCAAIDEESAVLVVGDGLFELWGPVPQRLRPLAALERSPAVRAPLVVASSGERALSGTARGGALLWDLARHRCVGHVALLDEDDQLVSASLSLDGAHLALGTRRGVLLVIAWPIEKYR